MVDSVAVEESDDSSSSPTLKVREKNNSKSTKIKTKSDYFGSLLRGGGKKTKIKTTAHPMEETERDPVSSVLHRNLFTIFVYIWACFLAVFRRTKSNQQ